MNAALCTNPPLVLWQGHSVLHPPAPFPLLCTHLPPLYPFSGRYGLEAEEKERGEFIQMLLPGSNPDSF